MPNISLTDLVDVVSRAGTPKATKVTEIKHREPYHPAIDFYKPLREAIVETHRGGHDKKFLTAFLATIGDPRKLSNYPEAVAGYKKWWGRKNLVWFEPPRTTYTHAGIDVIINPELGLEVDGQRHVIKLYLKSEPLTRFRVNLVTGLMGVSLHVMCMPGDVVALLDVRNGKLFTAKASLESMQAVVNAELAYIAALWPDV